MAITRSEFDSLCEEDLAELVQGQVPEGLHLDYKRDNYGTNDAQRKELLKDASAFANMNGGHIVIGLAEQDGVAFQLCGIICSDIDSEIQRIDQIVRTGIEPRIQGCRVRAVPLLSGSHAIVIRIPKSWHAPHRVSAQNSNRFWIRNSAGAHEASMEELRTLFTLSQSAVERARAFRAERLLLIQNGSGPRPLSGNGRFILHIVPLSAVSSSEAFDLEQVFHHHQAFWPLGSMGNSPRFNFDGVINERGGEINHGYTQVFRNGIIEATKASLITETHGKKGIAGLKLEQQFFGSLSKYINGLKAIGVEPPLVVMLTFEGVDGAYYYVIGGTFADDSLPIDRSILYLPECVINDYGNDADYHRAVRPAFDALWNAVGFSGSLFFDSDSGLWVGKKQA